VDITDKYIEDLFEGTDFGASTNSSVKAKRKQILKTLRDQASGYWSGQTAYHIVVHGGFLVDAKRGASKHLTMLGKAFMKAEG